MGPVGHGTGQQFVKGGQHPGNEVAWAGLTLSLVQCHVACLQSRLSKPDADAKLHWKQPMLQLQDL